jgi:hypothetical protein
MRWFSRQTTHLAKIETVPPGQLAGKPSLYFFTAGWHFLTTNERTRNARTISETWQHDQNRRQHHDQNHRHPAG